MRVFQKFCNSVNFKMARRFFDEKSLEQLNAVSATQLKRRS